MFESKTQLCMFLLCDVLISKIYDRSSSRALLKVGFHLEAQNLSLKNAALRVEKRAVTSST